MTDEIPRRARLERLTPAELAIRDAVVAVEAAGADERLTRAVMLLQEARDRVADWVDSVPVGPPVVADDLSAMRPKPLELLCHSEHRAIFRDGSRLVPATDGLMQLHLRSPGGEPFTVHVTWEAFEKHILPLFPAPGGAAGV